jgi:erythromycin esterase-like protein
MLSERLRKSLDKIAVTDDFFNAVCQNLWNKEIALLGEASHGTHEYYARRSEVTKELISKHDFRFIAVEGDWPSCFEINMYVKGQSPYPNAFEALRHSFERWPRWMWVNEDVREFVEWLRIYNLRMPEDKKV